MEQFSASFHIDQALSPRKNNLVRASSIGDCRRKLAYRIRWYHEGRPEPPMWSHLLSIFDVGHALHLQIQQRLSNQGPLKWVDADLTVDARGRPKWEGNCEIRLEDPEDWVAGHCDALSRPLRYVKERHKGVEFETIVPCEADDPEGQRFIIDIKTITARDRMELQQNPHTGQITGVKERPSGFARLTKPKDEHIAQTAIYSHLTTKPSFKADRIDGPLATLPGLMVIYAGKDVAPDWYAKFPDQYPEPRGLLNAPFKIYTQAANPRLIQALLKKVALVREHVERGTLPPRDYHHDPNQPAWACVDCPFKKECYEPEGYFQEEEPELPARLAHALIQLDEAEKVSW